MHCHMRHSSSRSAGASITSMTKCYICSLVLTSGCGCDEVAECVNVGVRLLLVFEVFCIMVSPSAGCVPVSVTQCSENE